MNKFIHSFIHPQKHPHTEGRVPLCASQHPLLVSICTFHTLILSAPITKLTDAWDFVMLTLHPKSQAQCPECGRHSISLKLTKIHTSLSTKTSHLQNDQALWGSFLKGHQSNNIKNQLCDYGVGVDNDGSNHFTLWLSVSPLIKKKKLEEN